MATRRYRRWTSQHAPSARVGLTTRGDGPFLFGAPGPFSGEESALARRRRGLVTMEANMQCRLDPDASAGLLIERVAPDASAGLLIERVARSADPISTVTHRDDVTDPKLIEKLQAISVLTVDTPEWKAAVNDFLVASEQFVPNIVRHIGNQPYIDRQNDNDELKQIVRETAERMLREVSNLTNGLLFVAWEAALITRSRSALRDYAQSPAATGFTESSGLIRRERAMSELKEWYQVNFGITLSDKELADTYNDRLEGQPGRVHASRANADDINGIRIEMLDSMIEKSDTNPVEYSVEERLRVEISKRIVDQTIVIASQRDPKIAKIAKVWLDYLRSGVEHVSAAQIARTLGCSPSFVRQHLNELRVIARGCSVVEGATGAASMAVARAVADAHLSGDELLGRIAELRYERWSERELVPADEIARRVSRDVDEVNRALRVLDEFVEHYLVVDGEDDDPD